jgi:hypothetical protein
MECETIENYEIVRLCDVSILKCSELSFTYFEHDFSVFEFSD